MDRLPYVDVFRGIAILVMIFFHFIHTFAPISIYTDFPYFIDTIALSADRVVDVGLFIFPPPPYLFLFVAGMSSYLLVTKRRSQGFTPVATAKSVAVKYGRYVVISLPFTWFVFGLNTWLAWEEALQGIGLTVIVLGLLYLVPRFTVPVGVGVMVVAAVLQAERTVIHGLLTDLLPATGIGLVDGVGVVLWNAVFGGYFSVTNLLPFAVGGLIMIKLLYEKDNSGRTLMYGLGLTGLSLLLMTHGFSSHFHMRDLPLAFFGAGSSMLIYYVVFRAWQRFPEATVFSVLAAFGQVAFLVYIWTWILVIKTAEFTGIAGTLGHGEAYVVSIAVTGVTVFAAIRYQTFRQANGPLILHLRNQLL